MYQTTKTTIDGKIMYESYTLSTAYDLYGDLSELNGTMILFGERIVEISSYYLSDDLSAVYFEDANENIILVASDAIGFEAIIEAYCDPEGPEHTAWTEFYDEYIIKQGDSEVIIRCSIK